MQQPPGHHLAEMNIGLLKYDWDDPRVREFVEALDQVNAVAERSPGFVWRMAGDDMGEAQADPTGAMGGDLRNASTLSIWEDMASLEHFVWNTVHSQFYDRRAEWYDLTAELRFVLWWVPIGHRPDMEEAMARFNHLDENGPSDYAFGWTQPRPTEETQ